MISLQRICLALAALAASGFIASAIAAPRPGQWAGVLNNGPTQIPVRLTIPDGQRGSLLFGAPVNCDVPLVFLGEQSGATIYNMSQNLRGGAFCDMQTGGRAQLVSTGDGGLLLDMTSGHRNMRYQGKLTPLP